MAAIYERSATTFPFCWVVCSFFSVIENYSFFSSKFLSLSSLTSFYSAYKSSLLWCALLLFFGSNTIYMVCFVLIISMSSFENPLYAPYSFEFDNLLSWLLIDSSFLVFWAFLRLYRSSIFYCIFLFNSNYLFLTDSTLDFYKLFFCYCILLDSMTLMTLLLSSVSCFKRFIVSSYFSMRLLVFSTSLPAFEFYLYMNFYSFSFYWASYFIWVYKLFFALDSSYNFDFRT